MLKSWALRLALSAVAFLATGCFAFDKSESADAPTQGIRVSSADVVSDQFWGSGEAAFKNTVHSLAIAHCTPCHASTKGPLFAAPNVTAAYESLLTSNKVAFPNYDDSTLLSSGGKLSDSHCGAYCNGAAVETWRSAIRSWWKGGECAKTSACATAQATKPLIMTAPLTVPSPLATGNQFSTLTFPLSGVSAELTGANLVVEIQQFGTSNGYLLRRPRITFGAGFDATQSVYVQDLQVAINGIADPNATTYRVVEQIVTPPSGPYLSLSTLITTSQKGPGADQIAIAFGAVQKAQNQCKNLAGFQQKVRPMLLSTNCTSCHATQGTFKLATTDSDAVLCARARQRINLSQPDLSPLIRMPRYGDLRRDNNQAHTKPAAFTQAEADKFVEWIVTE